MMAKKQAEKSGSSSVSLDRHKMNHGGRPAFWRDLAYDPEGLAAGAGQTRRIRLNDRFFLFYFSNIY